MSIEEEIRTIAKDELQTQLDDIEKRMRSSFRKESNEIKEQIQAVGTQMEEMGTLEEYLAECGFEIKNNAIFSKNEVVGFERSSLQISR